jgi:hypothetical protein
MDGSVSGPSFFAARHVARKGDRRRISSVACFLNLLSGELHEAGPTGSRSRFIVNS